MFEIAAKVSFGDFLLYGGTIWISFLNLEVDTIFTNFFYGHFISSKVFDASSSV
jgi:hypothetical protein